jgi:hypothetical protein
MNAQTDLGRVAPGRTRARQSEPPAHGRFETLLVPRAPSVATMNGTA